MPTESQVFLCQQIQCIVHSPPLVESSIPVMICLYFLLTVGKYTEFSIKVTSKDHKYITIISMTLQNTFRQLQRRGSGHVVESSVPVMACLYFVLTVRKKHRILHKSHIKSMQSITTMLKTPQNTFRHLEMGGRGHV
jgi:hypothetical protein